MKLLSSILALLMLFLSVQPVCSTTQQTAAADTCCAAIGDCSERDEHKSSHQEEGDCTACNPFQNCSCCVAGIILPVGPGLEQHLFFDTTHSLQPATEQPAFYSADLSGFWQPPRLG